VDTPLAEVTHLLACPHCGRQLAAEGRSLVCGQQHRFDVARQGYVNLTPTGTPQGSADTAAMVAARSAVLEAGHLAPVTAALVAAAHAAVPRTAAHVLDIGAGTGHHLAAVVDARERWLGVALDLSKHAMRRAARIHPRVQAVVGDAWQRLPLRDQTVDVVLCVFAPRNLREVRRVLRPRGAFVLASATAGHLAAVAEPLGLMTIDPAKQHRLKQDTRGLLILERRERCGYTLTLGHADVEGLVRMGPNAWHLSSAELHARLRNVPDPVETAFAVDLAVYRPAPKPAER
jgi:23S rRNA (guanine745-N1)-methyltransferase